MTVILTMLCWSLAAAEGEHIVAVKVQGNQRVESAAILNVVKVKSGEQLYTDKVDADIRAIYRLGQFADVSAETVPAKEGVTLVYEVKEKPIIRSVRIEGTKEISEKKVREALDIKPNTIYSPESVAKGIEKAKKLYADEGYYLAEVKPVVEKISPTEQNLLFKVTEGKKVLIESIRFEGNHAFSARQLRKAMETTEDWWLAWLTGAGVYKEDVLKNDVALITDLYYNNGYVNVKVGEPQVKLLPGKKGLAITIGITEGPQFRAGAIAFKGDLLEPNTELAKKLKLKSGEVFSRAALRSDVFALTDLYADKGYAFANINPMTRIDQEKKTVDVTFDMEKGEKVYIDRINVAGNTKTRDKVVRREIKLAEGDLYSSTAIRRSKQNLMNLGFFEEVNIATAKGSAENKLNLNVDVKEKPTGTFSIGAGYSSLDGIVGQGSVQQANFLGLGLKANASASLGSKSQTYNLGLTDPYFLDSRWTFGGDIYRTDRDYLDFTRRATGFDIKGGYPLSDNVNTFWLYKFEDKKIYNLSAALRDNIARGLALQPEATSTTSSVFASITNNSTDYRLDPTRGMIDTLSVEFAGLGGTNRYVRYITEHTLFVPVFWGGVLSTRGTVGYIQKVGGRDIPIDEKFYLGGINTLRGYSGRTVSPYIANKIVTTDINGISTIADNHTFLGGDSEAIINVEYTFPLLKDAGLKGVLFFDSGDAYDGVDRLFSRMQSSYGFGIRWFSPIGPLRLEYGIPINPRDGIDNSSGRLEFSIGSFF